LAWSLYDLKTEDQWSLMARVIGHSVLGPNCWEWNAAKDKDGYAVTSLKRHYLLGNQRGINFRTQRIMYEFVKGKIPEGKVLDHLCRNRACVNPAHLEAVSNEINLGRQVNFNGTRTHCKNGHPLSGDNLVPSYLKDGVRLCLICHKKYQKTKNHDYYIRVTKPKRRGERP
jgi:hypothetical protein